MSASALAALVAQRVRAYLRDPRPHVHRLLVAHFAGCGMIHGQGTRDDPWTVVFGERGVERGEIYLYSLFAAEGKLYAIPLREKQWRPDEAQVVCSLAGLTSFDGLLSPARNTRRPEPDTQDPRP